jgi:transposase
MPKGKELTDFERGEIIGLYKGKKYTQTEIIKILKHPKSTVGDVIKKYNEQGLTSTLPRPGRPKILSERDNRQLIKITKNNRNKTLEEITEDFNEIINKPVSSRTIQRTLHQEG